MPYAIHCETEELARPVLQIAHDAGLKWYGGRSLLERTNFGAYDYHTAYIFEPFQRYQTARHNRIGMEFSPVYFFKRQSHYVIVKAQDFIAANERYLLNRESI